MPIKGNYYTWKEKNVNEINVVAGVYTFFDRNKNLIYIGETTNLRKRFQGYWNTNFKDDPCKRATTSYKREFTDKHKEREEELLEEYKKEHDGKLPECNEIVA